MISIKKNYRPSIMPSSSNYVSDYELERMTSTDYYLDNYELQRYGGKTAKKYEEGIVNIVPKAWFFDVGEHIYYGTEYIIYADTIVINEDTMSLIYKYTPGSIPCKLNIFTHSYQDTNIAVYNSKGQFIAGNDDAYYDPDEDNSNYNAGCEIGLMTSETYYIIINSITRNTSNYRIEIVVNESYD